MTPGRQKPSGSGSGQEADTRLRTIVALRGGVSAGARSGRRPPFPIAAVLAVVAAVVKAGLRVLFQFLGQVGARRAGGNVVLVPVLGNLQLLDEAHRPQQPNRKWSVSDL